LLLWGGATGHARTFLENGLFSLSVWDHNTDPVVSLSGQWHFATDQLLTPDNFSRQTSAAQLQTVPGFWKLVPGSQQQSSLVGNTQGIGSYWLTLTGVPPSENLSLLLHRSCNNAKLYFFAEGQTSALTSRSLGRTSANARLTDNHAGSSLVPLRFSSALTHHIIIQVANHNTAFGGLCGEVKLGDTETLAKQLLKRQNMQAFLLALITMTGIYALAVYAQGRGLTPFWLGVTCLCWVIFFLIACGFLEAVINSQANWLFELRVRLGYLAMTSACYCLLRFYHSHFSGLLNVRSLHILKYLLLFNGVLIVCTPLLVLTSALPYFGLIWLGHFGASLWILIRSLHQSRDYSLLMLISIVPVIISVPYDVFNGAIFNDATPFTLYALAFFSLLETQIVGRKFTQAVKLANHLSDNLSKEVASKTAQLEAENHKLEETQAALEIANRQLKQLSIRDGLTRIYNRMYFEQEFKKEWRRCARKNSPVSILMVDVDHFKHINDQSGHLVGDQCLQAIAKELYNQFKRAGEVVARYGGEEFVILLPETDQRKALAIAEGIRSKIEKLDIEYRSSHYQLTISIGISTTIPGLHYSPSDLLRAADAALYDAKNKGRNCVSLMPLLFNKGPIKARPPRN
jgi:diguanylate cyclase (GGDEF)-like protein